MTEANQKNQYIQRNAPPRAAACKAALHTATQHLLGKMASPAHWEGRLSSSALSTATAISALSVAGNTEYRPLIDTGIEWLTDTQNADGGWGDTTDSPSNLATTMLAIAAFHLAGHESAPALAAADAYTAKAGADRTAAIIAAYGDDRTFAVPILANCALAGLVPWERIPSLPFELSVLPQKLFRFLRLHVVSYALPALIAIGMMIESKKPASCPVKRFMRKLLRRPALKKLAAIQPEHGGFLDATPLTSFVAMSLVPQVGVEHPVAKRCLDFIVNSARDDGSWPIDTNLSVWVTTNAVKALASAGRIHEMDTAPIAQWLLGRQYSAPHPYSGAVPGGWSWTYLPGGVPDVDDTSGGIIVMSMLGEHDSARRGIEWLLSLQNSDGGWPTFCRGWGKLPFDKSCPDLTAHALRALNAVRKDNALADRIDKAIERGVQYLTGCREAGGCWTPLWFGNQAAPHHANSVLGTAFVARALAELNFRGAEYADGVQYLLRVQNDDDGWGGASGMPSTVEETAVATAALADSDDPQVQAAARRGAGYLIARIVDGTWKRPSPVGLYFASLWYSEEMYPVIWTIDALGRVASSGLIDE